MGIVKNITGSKGWNLASHGLVMANRNNADWATSKMSQQLKRIEYGYIGERALWLKEKAKGLEGIVNPALSVIRMGRDSVAGFIAAKALKIAFWAGAVALVDYKIMNLVQVSPDLLNDLNCGLWLGAAPARQLLDARRAQRVALLADSLIGKGKAPDIASTFYTLKPGTETWLIDKLEAINPKNAEVLKNEIKSLKAPGELVTSFSGKSVEQIALQIIGQIEEKTTASEVADKALELLAKTDDAKANKVKEEIANIKKEQEEAAKIKKEQEEAELSKYPTTKELSSVVSEADNNQKMDATLDEKVFGADSPSAELGLLLEKLANLREKRAVAKKKAVEPLMAFTTKFDILSPSELEAKRADTELNSIVETLKGANIEVALINGSILETIKAIEELLSKPTEQAVAQPLGPKPEARTDAPKTDAEAAETKQVIPLELMGEVKKIMTEFGVAEAQAIVLLQKKIQKLMKEFDLSEEEATGMLLQKPAEEQAEATAKEDKKPDAPAKKSAREAIAELRKKK